MVLPGAVAGALAAAKSSPLLFLAGRQRAIKSVFKFQPFSSSSPPSRKLILYSKPGCCLCDGLKEKLQAAFLISGPDSLHDVHLQIRDITTNPEWERAYQYEIPVLAKLLPDGTEYARILLKFPADSRALARMKPGHETLPRLSPRLGVELVQKKIAAAMREQDT